MRLIMFLLALACVGCYEMPRVPTAAEALSERLAVVEVERAACVRLCDDDASCRRCTDVARERIEGETEIIMAEYFPRGGKP